jgi:hypothetical protein
MQDSGAADVRLTVDTLRSGTSEHPFASAHSYLNATCGTTRAARPSLGRNLSARN